MVAVDKIVLLPVPYNQDRRKRFKSTERVGVLLHDGRPQRAALKPRIEREML